ncbi:hypothetical protein GQR58_020916 [Nymphon striatum]|nr:hypothetical protein GQR58_020916 [Nymphon striatum]
MCPVNLLTIPYPLLSVRPSYVGTKPEPRRQYSPSNDLAVRCLAEMGVTRKSKDYVDCEKFITWFQERNPFNFKDEHLHSLSSGLVSKTTHEPGELSPADLFISNSDKKILSKEGATQGDNSAMGFYSCSTIPLVRNLDFSAKVDIWIEDLEELSRIATREPQVAYAAYIYGLSKRWTYVCRTTPDISEMMKRLERKVFSLPARDGGLSIYNISEISDAEYDYSVRVTAQQRDAIYDKCSGEYFENDNERYEAKESITKDRLAFFKQKHDRLISQLNEHNALALRYNFQIKDVVKVCACGEVNSVNHWLICKKGGYVSLRHNWVRDVVSKLLVNVKCKDVQIEPPLLSTRDYQLPCGSITADQARLDISARSVWNKLGRAFFDVRVFHAPAPSNMNKSIPQMYSHHDNLKKRAYNARVIQVEKGTFTPLVFSTTGGMEREAHRFLKRLAERT